MRIEFLGTGGFHPNDRRKTACLMIPELGLVFDAGTAAYRIAHHLETKSLDLFLSHAHLDHICGLTYLITLPLMDLVDEIRIYGRAEVLETVREHLFSDPVFPVAPPYQFQILEEHESYELPGNFLVEWQRLPSHPGDSTAFKISKNNSSIAYVTDTSVDGTYTEFIRGVDLLIHECYFPDERSDWALKTGHSYASQTAQLAHDADVQRLIVIHTDPLCESDDPIGLEGMQKLFPAVEIAEDGLSIDWEP